jgi:hypothetical protein
MQQGWAGENAGSTGETEEEGGEDHAQDALIGLRGASCLSKFKSLLATELPLGV